MLLCIGAALALLLFHAHIVSFHFVSFTVIIIRNYTRNHRWQMEYALRASRSLSRAYSCVVYTLCAHPRLRHSRKSNSYIEKAPWPISWNGKWCTLSASASASMAVFVVFTQHISFLPRGCRGIFGACVCLPIFQFHASFLAYTCVRVHFKLTE